MAKIHIGNLIFPIERIRIEYIKTDAIQSGCEITLPDNFNLSTILADIIALKNQTLHGVSVYDDQDTNKLWETDQDLMLGSMAESIDFSLPADQDGYQKIISFDLC